MNNTIFCQCLECGNEFDLPVPNLLDENPDDVIGELFWCGTCDSHNYDCFWGLFAAGHSSDKLGEVLRIWCDWASSYRKAPRTPGVTLFKKS